MFLALSVQSVEADGLARRVEQLLPVTASRQSTQLAGFSRSGSEEVPVCRIAM
jgi:hypothetical protein